MIQTNTSLKELSYYRTGGLCRRLYLPRTIAECAQAMVDVKQRGLTYLILGGGTNSLVTDEYWDGAVIALYRMREVSLQGGRLVCDGGADNTDVAQFALAHGLAGVEFMQRLPGQIGGTVRMNARCYGGEMSQVVSAVTTVSPEGGIRLWQSEGVFKGYKDTVFMRNAHLVVACEITLAAGDRQEIAARMKVCEDDRVTKHQFDYPSCGCIFKNDYTIGVSSGVLLEQAGAKMLSAGAARVSPWHANFVFNGGASAYEILALTLEMREQVWQKFGVWLEYEMEILGRLPPELESQVREKRAHAPVMETLSPIRQQVSRPTEVVTY